MAKGKVKEIYRYTLKDAWGCPRHGFRVLDNNTVIVGTGMLSAWDEEPPVSVTEESINRIHQAIQENDGVFNIKKHIDSSEGVLDGYGYEFFVNGGTQTVEVTASNIEYSKSVNAETIMELHNRIGEILVEQGFNKKYFLLYEPIAFDEDDILDFDEACMVACENNTIFGCAETKDAFIFDLEPPSDIPSDSDSAIVVLKKGGMILPILEYMMNKEEYGLKPEDDEVIAEHDVGKSSFV